MFEKRLKTTISVINNKPVTGHYNRHGKFVDIRKCYVRLHKNDLFCHIITDYGSSEDTHRFNATPTYVKYFVDANGEINATATLEVDTGDGIFTIENEYDSYNAHVLQPYFPVPDEIRKLSNEVLKCIRDKKKALDQKIECQLLEKPIVHKIATDEEIME